jgi:hypothetical protein
MRDSLLEKAAKGGAGGLLSSLFQGKWTKGLGSSLKEMAGRAAMQAGTGALVGGVANKIRGGSFGSGALSGAMGGFTGGSIGSGLVNNPKKQWLGDVIGGALGGGVAGAMVPPAIQAMGMEPGSMPNLEGTPQAGFNKYSSFVKQALKPRPGATSAQNPVDALKGKLLGALLAHTGVGAGIGALSAGEDRRLAGAGLGALGGLAGAGLGAAAGGIGGLGLGAATTGKVVKAPHRPPKGSPAWRQPKGTTSPLGAGLHTIGSGVLGSALGGVAGTLGGAYVGGRAARKTEGSSKPTEPKKEEPAKEAPKKEAKPEAKETPKEKKAMANEALEVLFNQVYLPAFLEKAAELNVNITTADELDKVLDTTARVKQAMIEDKSNTFTEVANAAKGLAQIPQEKEAEARPSHSEVSQMLASNPYMLQMLGAAKSA